MENYESLGVIGEGTYGVVIRARHRETGQIVAIKKFKESDEDEQVRKTSLREVRVLKQLRHENIITLLEVFRRKGKLYLVFEYVEKTILEVLEKRPNGLDELDVKRFMYQLLRGVEYCHAHNIIHRDIKPENILISKSGALKLCDFGFARTMSSGGKYTDYVATRWYRGPELLVGDVEYGKGVDIWAIGCIFAEISNGMPLFPGESDVDQLSLIMRCFGKLTPKQIQTFRRNPLYVGVDLPAPRDIETLDQRFPNVPRNWLAFLKTCLKNDPEQRETCAGLMNMPYFTENNFKQEFENELRVVFEKENRSLMGFRDKQKQPQQQQQQQGDPSQPGQPPSQTTPTGQLPATQLPNQTQLSQQSPLPHQSTPDMPQIPNSQTRHQDQTKSKMPQAPNYTSLWSQYLNTNQPNNGDSLPDLGSKVQLMQQQQQMQQQPKPYYEAKKTSLTHTLPAHTTPTQQHQQHQPQSTPFMMMGNSMNNTVGHTSSHGAKKMPLGTQQQSQQQQQSHGDGGGAFPSLQPGGQQQQQQQQQPTGGSSQQQGSGMGGNQSLGLYKKKPKKQVLSTLSMQTLGGPQTQGYHSNNGGHAPGLMGGMGNPYGLNATNPYSLDPSGLQGYHAEQHRRSSNNGGGGNQSSFANSGKNQQWGA